jgi:hypothetical protein
VTLEVLPGAPTTPYVGPNDDRAAKLAGVSLSTAGPTVNRAAATPAQPAYLGGAVGTFGGDFYDRVHYSWLVTDLGNVIGLQSVTLYVWNAYRRSEVLNQISGAGTDGVSLSSPVSTPYPFRPLQELAFTFTVGVDGPATLDATYTFDWQTVDATVRLTGSRITAWSFLPDWTAGVLERLEWRTDVLPSFDGREQRRALRIAPRQSLEFDAVVLDADQRYAEAVIYGWGARTWALPIWPDGQALAVAVAAGAMSVPLDTSTRAFQAGGLLMLMTGTRTFEVVEVDSVTGSVVLLKRPLSASWPATATTVYPARPARIKGSATMQRWTSGVSGMRLAFDVVETVIGTADAGTATHRGYPVLATRPNWAGAPELDYSRKLAELDNAIGPPVYDDEAGIPLPRYSLRYTAMTRAEVDGWRRLAYALRGRHGSIWMPTWADDLRVVAPIDDLDAAISFEHVDHVKFVGLGTGRRDIRIELTDGAVYYRRITSAAVISPTVERMTIDAALGRDIAVADVALVSFMALVRLDADQIELAYWTGDVADVAVSFRGFQHDV